jgi:hypothetical protein
MKSVNVGLCCHEDAEAFILFEDKPSERRTELQMRDFSIASVRGPLNKLG